MENANSPEYLEKIKNQVIENLKRTAFAPSVQMQDVPRDPVGMDDEADAILDDEDEDEHKDERMTQRRWDKYVEKDGELSESEDETENRRNGVRRQTGPPRRRNIMDYQNANAASDDEKPRRGSVRARSHESGNVNGATIVATNGSGLYYSNTPSPAPSQQSAEDATMEDADIDQDEEQGQDTAEAAQPAVEAQEATPPDSPPNVTSNTAHHPASSSDIGAEDAADIRAREEHARLHEDIEFSPSPANGSPGAGDEMDTAGDPVEEAAEAEEL
jgi:histone deacetylase 1/2